MPSNAGCSEVWYSLAAFGPTTAAIAFVYTWVYNQIRGSLLMVLLLHGALHASIGLVMRLGEVR